MRSENMDRCLGSLGGLPGAGDRVLAAQPTVVLTCTAGRGSSLLTGAETGVPIWVWGPACLLIKHGGPSLQQDVGTEEAA